MKLFLFLCFMMVLGIGDKNSSTVDILETNHVYDKNGLYVFTQVIAWKIMPDDGKPHNLGWKVIKEPFEFPCKSAALWYIIVDNKKIYAKMHIQRWLNFDIERQDTDSYWHNQRPNIFEKTLDSISEEEK